MLNLRENSLVKLIKGLFGFLLHLSKVEASIYLQQGVIFKNKSESIYINLEAGNVDHMSNYT